MPLVEIGKRSYAEAVAKKVEREVPLMQVDVDKLVTSSFRGSEVVITLSESIYQQSMEECISNVLDHIIFTRHANQILMEEVYK